MLCEIEFRLFVWCLSVCVSVGVWVRVCGVCIFPGPCVALWRSKLGAICEDEATFKRRRAVEIKHGRIVILSDLSKRTKLKQ